MTQTIRTEKLVSTLPGLLMLPVLLVAAAAFFRFGVGAFQGGTPIAGVFFFFGGFLSLFCLGGLFVVNPNEARVLQLFGDYVGTAKEDGLRWANPFYSKRSIMLRVRNFESAKLKVNDHDGNPIEIGAVVVWKVVDTAEACFEVDNYEHYMNVQTEAAIRNLASHYPYDAHIEGEFSLRGSTDEVAARLKTEIQARLEKAGVRVIEARLSHLAYAPEIASAMLRRQQAGAIIAARQRIVEGAVGMVEQALDLLQKSDKVHLDDERKAAMVSNLLVVLCADREAQPVVNTGSIY
jgi:regulator of protease activity HflC (stomatin/prohibitin superfamily)